MTWYAYNTEGWHTGPAAEGAAHATPEPPPGVAASEPTPGELWPRWWRYGWTVEAYPMPAVQPTASAFDADGWFAGQVSVGTPGSTRARPDIESTTTTPGEPRSRWRYGSWAVEAYAPRPLVLTRRAFQNRFPKLADGVSTKYDAVSLFLTNAAFAAELMPDAEARQTLQLQIQTGLNRMGVSAVVDLSIADAALFTGLLMQPHIPVLFQLGAPERAAILSAAIQESERP